MNTPTFRRLLLGCSCAAILILIGCSPSSANAQIGKEWQLKSPLPTPERLTGVVWTGTRYVVVGENGVALTSTDASNWTMTKLGNDDFTSLAWSGTTMLAVSQVDNNDDFAAVRTSSDGLTWTASHAVLPGGKYADLRRAIWTGTQWAGVVTNYNGDVQGDSQTLVTSTDGITWTSLGDLPAVPDNHYRGIDAMVFTGSRYIITGYENTETGTQGFIFSTSDGSSWSVAGGPVLDGEINDVAWTGSQAVAVSQQGGIFTSLAGDGWTQQAEASGHSGSSFYNVLWTGSKLFITGQNVQSSTNGVNWTLEEDFGPFINVSLWNGSQAVGVGYGGKIATSDTGAHWTQSLPNGPNSDLVGMVKTATTYVAADHWGSAMVSSDLVTWTLKQMNQFGGLQTNDLAWTGSTVVAVGNGVVTTSADGSTWAVNSTSFTHGEQLMSVAYAASQLVAVGSDSSGQHAYVATSPDGFIWASRPVSAAFPGLRDVARIGTQWVAVGSNGTILTSPTGVTWTKKTSGTTNNLTGIAANSTNTTLVAVGDNGTILSSTNAGATWITRAAPDSFQTYKRLNHVTWAGGASGNFIVLGEAVLTSPDGITWTQQDPGTHVELTNSCWDSNQLIGVGNAGIVSTTDAVPSASFVDAAQTVFEGDGTVYVQVRLSFEAQTQVIVPITLGGTASNVSDYNGAAVPAQLIFGPHETLKALPITLVTDNVVEPDKTIIATLGSVTGARTGGQQTHTVTIKDDDSLPTASFVQTSATVNENVGTIGVEVQLSWQPNQTTTVPITVSGTVDSSDYSLASTTLTFAAGERSKMVSITINDDTTVESDETLVLGFGTMTNATPGANTTFTLTIKDNDPSSQPGRQWASHNLSPTSEGMDGIAWTGSQTVIVGDLGLAMTSTDGVNWVRRYTGVDVEIHSVLWTGNTTGLIAVGDQGHVLTSMDGILWADHVVPGAGQVKFTAISGIPGEFVITGFIHNDGQGTDTPVLYRSSNGLDWTQRLLPPSASGMPRGITYLPAWGYVIVGAGNVIGSPSAQFPLILTSGDGFSWVDRSNAVGGSVAFTRAQNIGGKVYAFANDTKVYTSADLIAWTPQTIGTGPLGALCNATQGNMLVAVGKDIATAPIGSTTWTQHPSGTSATLTDVVWFGGNAYMAISKNTIVRTNDGINWTKVSTGIDLSTDTASAWGYLGVAWNGKKFVAVGGTQPGSSAVATSADGITWTPQTIAGTAPLMAITWSGTQFVAVGLQGLIRTSPDGITWVARASGTTLDLHAVTWANGQFVAVGGDEDDDDFRIGPPGSILLTSPNGITWTRRTIPAGKPLEGIFFNGTSYIATGRYGILLTSTDSINWTSHPTGYENTDFRNLAWNGTTYVGGTYSHGIVTSTDGIHWSDAASVPPPEPGIDEDAKDLASVVWTGSIFAIAGANGTLYTSHDGQTWTAQETGTHRNLHGICWNGSTLVAVGINGVIITSGGGTPPTPTVQFAVNASSVKEGATANVVVTLTPAPTGPVTVPFSLTYGTASIADITPPTSLLVFNPGETSKFITIPIKEDSLDENDETLTLALLPATGANPGGILTHLLTIQDNDTAPAIAPQPQHQLLAIGQPLVLVSGATGSGTIAYQWKKKSVGAATFANVAGATSPVLFKSAVTLADAGTYKLVATNAVQPTEGDAVEVGVFDGSYNSFALADGTITKSFTQSAAGNGLSYGWMDDSDNPISALAGHLTITNNVLTINNIAAGDARLYKCQVTQSASSLRYNAGKFDLQVITAKPVWSAFTLASGQVGFSYSAGIAGNASTGATFSATGLPAGLKMDVQGNITGVPAAVANNQAVTITATNAKGASPVVTHITITALPGAFVTEFQGLADRHPTVNNGLGSRVKFTISASGVCTGNVITAATTSVFTGPLTFSTVMGTTTATGVFTTPVIAGRTFTISATFAPANVTGTIGEGPASLPPTSTVNFNAYRSTSAPADFKGSYNFALTLPMASQGDLTMPQGQGYGSVVVAPAGTYTLSGKLGDGTAYASSGFIAAGLAANEGPFLIYAPLYGNKGTVIGDGKLVRGGTSPAFLDTQLQGNSLSVTWNKPTDTTPAGARSYPAGWAPIALGIVGSKYIGPGSGERVLNLPDGAGKPNASLGFDQGGVQMLSADPSMDIEFKLAGAFTAAPHALGTTFSMTPSTGAFKGTFTVPGRVPAASNYEGLMIRYFNPDISDWSYQGVGWFLLAQAPSPDVSPTPPASTTPILAGHVFLGQ